MLEEIISQQRPKDWPVVALALCLFYFGIESMQVDVYLRAPKAKSICNTMDETAIFILNQIFASTGGFKLLKFDWSRDEHAVLVDHDVQSLKTLRGLRELSQEYRKREIHVL